MTTNDPRQPQMIKEAMKAIAERKPGRTKLVYDTAKRTIVAVSAHAQTSTALDITAEDADMFAIVTLSCHSLQAGAALFHRLLSRSFIRVYVRGHSLFSAF